MVSKIASSALEFIDNRCEDIGGNSLRQTIVSGAGLLVTATTAYAVNELDPCYSTIYYVAMAINVLCIATLLKNAIQWRNVVAFVFSVTILNLIGFHIHSNSHKRHYDNIEPFTYCVDAKGNEHPVLVLSQGSPFYQGYELGLTTADKVVFAYRKIFPALEKLGQMLTGDVNGTRLDETVKQYTIPKRYEEEMLGLVQGVNDWCKANKNRFRLTFDQVKRIHCYTDTYKIGNESFTSKTFRYLWNTVFGEMGCSTIIMKRNKEMMVARNLDWPGLKIGQLHFFVSETKPNGDIIISKRLPGLIISENSTLIVKDKVHLTVIANECPILSRFSGIPSGLWLRDLVGKCSNLKEVEEYVKDAPIVASSFHLIVADGRRAINYQMHADSQTYFLKRELAKNGNLIVTNHVVDPETDAPYGRIPPAGTSAERFEAIKAHLEKPRRTRSLETLGVECLQLPSTNRPVTLESTLRRFDKLETSIVSVYSDGWAADKLSRHLFKKV